MKKAEFWWASIYGADPEPVEKAEHDGRPCVYTLGCADPFYLDGGAVEFVGGKIDRPMSPAAAKLVADDWQAQRDAARKGIKTYVSLITGKRSPVSTWAHSWRGPR